MKRMFTLCMGLMVMLAVWAQNDFPIQFADKNGNIIADGTTVTINTAEDDGFGELLMSSGLYAKNQSAATVHCAGTFTVKSMSNGVFQSCFPGNCMQARSVGQYTTQDGDVTAGELKNMQTEWLPTKNGVCEVVYQLISYKQNAITKKWNKDKEGPVITLKFDYNTTGIATTKHETATDISEYFDLQGRPVAHPAGGMYVKKTRFADGTHQIQKLYIR